MPHAELRSLAHAIAEARTILTKHANGWADDRLADLERRLLDGDGAAVVSALSEATGSMGSLNDRIISPGNGDNLSDAEVGAVNSRLRTAVRNIEQQSRVAAKTLGIALVR